MRILLPALLLMAACLSAQVRFAPDSVSVEIGGKPFTTFHYGADAAKPFLAPLRSASGKIVTRRFPMQTIPGESRDHLHHRGLWFSTTTSTESGSGKRSVLHQANLGRITVRTPPGRTAAHSRHR